jgi:Cu+-exporting ATPase
MPTIEAPRRTTPVPKTSTPCYHCGTACFTTNICIEDKVFCCDGCKMVFEIIHTHDLCNYYELQDHPGLNNLKTIRREKYAFLDNEDIAQKLYRFSDGDLTIVTFYIPGVHCSSCMWLLEHLRRINDGITESRLNFSTKEVTIHFSKKNISLRQIADLLTTIGYEPYISLEDTTKTKVPKTDRSRLYRMGIAGFCFANIMMMSFPEYLGGSGFEHKYASFLRWLNLLLGLPVFFYSAGEFFGTAWKGLKVKTLNIDAPIALAILITFSRSLYEIISGTGAGYLDSMSGIVFFMLVGRVVQERTYRSLSFHRDYKSYFPIAVTVFHNGQTSTKSLHELKEGDTIKLYHDEIIPADGTLLSDNAHIDYSFVTGESEAVHVHKHAPVYAGGRQTGESVMVRIEKPVAGSYLTSLWNHQAFAQHKSAGTEPAGIQALSRYFTIILFTLAAITGIYWAVQDPSKILNSVTAMLIVACPCALLLSATFTHGNLLRLFSRSGLYLRDASVIESLGKTDHIVFDKTGTLTQGTEVSLLGDVILSADELGLLHSVTRSSKHPYSKALAAYSSGAASVAISQWKETAGQGIEAIAAGTAIKIGSAAFTGQHVPDANVYACIGDQCYAFSIKPQFRNNLQTVIQKLQQKFGLSMLSGDHAGQQAILRTVFGTESQLSFNQQPLDKLLYIERLQQEGHRVLMVGDGLNDAGALQQSNVGITLADDINNFTPSCDAILDARQFEKIPAFLGLARAGSRIIRLSFIISVLYNLCGLFFAVQGKLNPMIAAILMPASTLSIVLISTITSALSARSLGLKPMAEAH